MSSSYPFVIHHEKLNLYLAVAELSSLYLHEEVIPRALDQLVEAIKVDGVIRHPVIVDLHTYVVLDGMHRVAAAEKLGCKRIPVCLVDYENDSIKVGCWYRTIRGDGVLVKIKEIMDKMGLFLEKISKVEQEQLGIPPIVGAFTDLENSFLICQSFEDLKQAYDILKNIEENLRQFRFNVEHETEFDAMEKLKNKEVGVVLLTPRLTKKNIVETALSGKVFAYKATRHIIPARPLNINVPLSMLCDNSESLLRVNAMFKRLLEKKRLKRMAAGSIFEGRRYEEDVYVFEG
jgi:predicted transcriptional regulator